MKKYAEIQELGINIWENFKDTGFKTLIANHEITSTFYSRISKGENPFKLGHFDYLIDLSNSYKEPRANVSLNKPKASRYLEYNFENNNLTLVKHFKDEQLVMIYYVTDDYIFELTPNYELNYIWSSMEEFQLDIGSNGTFIRKITILEQNNFKSEESDIISYSTSKYTYDGMSYIKTSTDIKVIKLREDINYLNGQLLSKKVAVKELDLLINTLKDRGYTEN